MFPFFNKNFFQLMLGQQRTLEVKAPNGAMYRYTTNTIDEKTYNEYCEKLDEAVKNNNQEEFDKIWSSLTEANSFNLNFENEFKKLHSEMEKFFEETNSYFKTGREFITDKFKTPPVSHESIDEKIKKHEEKIEELKKLKNDVDIEKAKTELKGQISKLKIQLDEKLVEFSKNLENEEMKSKISVELTKINREIKSLEEKLKNM